MRPYSPSDEGLTRLGRHLGEMPVHPRVGKMLLYATLLGVLDPVLTVACAAAYRSPFVMSMEGGRAAGTAARVAFSNEAGGASDHLSVVQAFAGWEKARRDGGGGAERVGPGNILGVNVIGCPFTKTLRIQNALDDVASSILQAL